MKIAWRIIKMLPILPFIMFIYFRDLRQWEKENL